MITRFILAPSLAAHDSSAVFRMVGCAALQIVCLAAIAVAVLGGRYLLYEYTHGDRQVVVRLLDTFLP
jgi:hypothetical protein